MQASSTSHRHGPSPLDRTPRVTQRPDRAPCASTTCVPFHQAFVLVHFLDTIASATPSPSAPARPSVREVPGAWCPHGGGEIRRRYGIPPELVSFAPVREASREGQSHPIRVQGGADQSEASMGRHNASPSSAAKGAGEAKEDGGVQPGRRSVARGAEEFVGARWWRSLGPLFTCFVMYRECFLKAPLRHRTMGWGPSLSPGCLYVQMAKQPCRMPGKEIKVGNVRGIERGLRHFQN